jgi:hypothetical protein
VLGEGAGRTHGAIEAARRPVERAPLADVVARVDDEHDLRVDVDETRRDVQFTGAQRDGPVDAPQPVADRERADRCKLDAVALAPGVV